MKPAVAGPRPGRRRRAGRAESRAFRDPFALLRAGSADCLSNVPPPKPNYTPYCRSGTAESRRCGNVYGRLEIADCRKTRLPSLQFPAAPFRPEVLAEPLIDERSDVGVSFPGVLSNCLGNLRLQINRDVELNIGAEKLPALALRKVIFFLHGQVSSYWLVSLLFAFRAEMIRILHSPAEISENVWMTTRALPRLSFPMLTHRSSCSLALHQRWKRPMGPEKLLRRDQS